MDHVNAGLTKAFNRVKVCNDGVFISSGNFSYIEKFRGLELLKEHLLSYPKETCPNYRVQDIHTKTTLLNLSDS